MRGLLAAWIVLIGWGMASAADQELTPLHPPTPVAAPLCVPPAFEQPSRMAVWDYYAVDRHGAFRPRVPLTLAPFNPATVRPMIYMPYIFD